jgi:hypothetical protein
MATKKKVELSVRERFSEPKALLSSLISLVFVLHVLTYKSFFFINPFSAVTPWLAFEQTLSMVGWVCLTIFPPFILAFRDRIQSFNSIFLLSWVVWPVALVLIRVSLLASTGNPFITYLATYPIFIFTDIVVPVIYFVIWRNNRT